VSETAPAHRRRRRSRVGRGILIGLASLAIGAQLGVIAAGAWAAANPRIVADRVTLLTTDLDATVAAYADRAGLSREGVELLHVSFARIVEPDRFDEFCSRDEPGIGVLGCYTLADGRIYLYDVENAELAALEPVVAAHEMLHAAWDRLTADEQDALAPLLEQAFAALGPQHELVERIAAYEADDPGSRDRGSSSASPSASSLGRERFEPPPAPAGAPTLRVLSFNVNFGVGHDPRNIAAVAEADADLVLLQETTDASEAAFREALADAHPHVLFQYCCNAGGLGVLSKHPIREEVWIEPVDWFPAWRVVVDTPLGAVQALNVHLRPPMSDGGSWAAGYFTTRENRRTEIEAFWRELDPALPTIVAGDFNEDERGRAIEFLAERGLRSALPQVEPRAKTWRWQTKLGKLRLMLDHVVYGPQLELRSAEVLDRGTSDHLPVLVVLGAADRGGS